MRLAYREDAPPFSYKDNLGEPVGYMVDLCKAVAGKLTERLNLPSLDVSMCQSMQSIGLKQSSSTRPTFFASRQVPHCPGASWWTSQLRPSLTAPAS
jgi:ABC-type amino acid transport substrate-binding protein